MVRAKVFPDHPLSWYLVRGTLVGGAIGAGLGLLLVLFMSGMGDGGSDPAGMIADDVRGLIPYVVGWVVNGFALGLLWWAVGKMLRRSSS
jgi:hypothetical protein